MNKKDRKKLLIDLDLTSAEIAGRLGYSRTYVSLLMNGKRRCEKAEKRIAEIVGKPAEEFFGEANGRRTTCH